MRRAMATYCLALGCVVGGPIPRILGAESAAPKILYDFDREALSLGWSIVGKAQAYRDMPPEISNIAAGPAGSAVHLLGEGLGGIRTKVGLLSQDWQRVDEVSLWVWRPVELLTSEQSPVVELQFVESDGHTRFWQKIDVAHQGWQEYRLPLCWFRWSTGRVPKWADVKTLGLMLRGKGEVWVDNIAVREAEDGRGAAMTSAKLLPLAFPDTPQAQRKAKETKRVLVATNAAGLNVDAVSNHLEKVVDTIEADLPFLKQSDAQGILVVFRDRQEYQGFLPRLAAQLQAQVNYQPPGSGYTTHKIATSFWDPRLGPLRPVFAHEFLHSYIESAMSIPCVNEWFQEGIANCYQMRLHPQADMAQMLKTALNQPAYQVPLKSLCSGRAIEMRSYWQAATLADLLIRSPKYREAFPKLVAAFQQSGSTNLDPHIKGVLSTDWPSLQDDWATYTTETYCK